MVIAELMKYTATYLPNDEQQKNFREVFLSTYHDNSEAKWVPERLSKGYTSLSGNKAIDSGIRRLKALAKRSVEEQMDATTQIRDVRKSLADFREIETKMASFDPSQKNIDYVKLRALFKELEGAKSAIDDSVKKGIASKALDIGKPSMLTSYKRLVEESKKASIGLCAVAR